jgi:hypothetical protein
MEADTMRTKALLHAAATLVCPCIVSTALAADWMQFGYDAAHSGNNTAETTLTQGNVDQLVRRYQATLPANVDSAPVFLGNVDTSSGTKDLLFLLAQDGTLMALDAADGSVVWSHAEPGQQPTTSAPAIDPGREYVYAYGLDGFVHKYHVGNGNEVTSGGWPELVTLKTDVEKAAASLTIATSGGTTYLYVVTDGYSGDAGDYQGHLTTINLANGDQNVFNTLCSDNPTHLDHGGNNCERPLASDFGGSGIWGRGGATFDADTNRVYIATGNGWFDANMAGFNWGDSVLALVANGAGSSSLPDDSYTPDNFLELFNSDTDLGSVSLAILPVPSGEDVSHLGAQLGKDAKIRLIDLDNMSGANGRRRAAAARCSAGRQRHERATRGVGRHAGPHVAAGCQQFRRVRSQAAVQRSRRAFARLAMESRRHREIGDRRERRSLLRRELQRRLLHVCRRSGHR